MDPPHITEFASERYFNKLTQLRDSPQGQDGPATPTDYTPPPPPPIPSQSTFILPLRASKSADIEPEIVRPNEQRRHERGRLFGLRSKVSLLHSKSSITPQPQDQPKPLVTETTRPRRYGHICYLESPHRIRSPRVSLTSDCLIAC
jgi:hypothetical protein